MGYFFSAEGSFEPPGLMQSEEKSEEMIPSPRVGSFVPFMEMVNYLGYSNKHRMAVAGLLVKQAASAR